MIYKVKELGQNNCHSTLIAENDVEKRLLTIKDEREREDKAFTFQTHYQRAITSKINLKALLRGITEDSYPVKVFATYISEGESLSNR